MTTKLDMGIDWHERLLRGAVNDYRSDHIILAVSEAVRRGRVPGREMADSGSMNGYFPSFVAARLAEAAMRWSAPDRRLGPSPPEFDVLFDLAAQVMMASPPWTQLAAEEINEIPAYLLVLPYIASQWSLQPATYGRQARAVLLFEQAVEDARRLKNLPAFPYEDVLHELYGGGIRDFAKVCALAYAGSMSAKYTLRRSYFQDIARDAGITVPPRHTVDRIVNRIAGDPTAIENFHVARNESTDRSYRMFDLSSLLTYPMLRPWDGSARLPADQDRIVAPIPDLLLVRVSNGIYHDLLSKKGKDFTDWFGRVHEAHVFRVLNGCLSRTAIQTEHQIQKTGYAGTVVDFVVEDGDTLILIEAKAVRYNRASLVFADKRLAVKNLDSLRVGLRQLTEYATAYRNGEVPQIPPGRKILKVFLSYEPLYQLDSPIGRDFISNHVLDEDERHYIDDDTLLLTTQELEALQPHIAAGFGFRRALDLIRAEDFYSALSHIQQTTGQTYWDSDLYEGEREIYFELGFDKIERLKGKF